MSDQHSQLRWVAGTPVLRPETEIDAANADDLRSCLLEAMSSGSDIVIVDMSATAFCDSTGLNVLVRAHKRLEGIGGELRVVIREPTLLRIFAVTGISTMFHMFASLDDALADVRAVRSAAESGTDR